MKLLDLNENVDLDIDFEKFDLLKIVEVLYLMNLEIFAQHKMEQYRSSSSDQNHIASYQSRLLKF